MGHECDMALISVLDNFSLIQLKRSAILICS